MELTKRDEKKLKKLFSKGYTLDDIANLGEALEKQSLADTKNYRIGKSHFRALFYGDTHFGNVQSDYALHDYAVKVSEKENVDAVIHLGDICDGWYQNRPTSIFEQNAIGVDQQLNLAVENMSKFKKPIYFITGNHEYNTFMRGAGIEVGPYIQDKLNNAGAQAIFLGNAEGDITLSSGTKIKLLHPDGGTAYAISYRMQKIVESLEGGKKPHLLACGHFHKVEQLFYRNVHVLQTGTLEGQTKFMRGKNIPAHKGFWVVDIHSRKGGQIDKLVTQLYPAYE